MEHAWPTNDWRTFLAHSLELKHSWGKKPEQKAREKEYNHEYYEKNKERILAARKKHGDSNYSGNSTVEGDEGTEYEGNTYGNIGDEERTLEELMKLNAEMGGYDEAAMENIRQHNENILKNISALEENVNEYIATHPDMSEEQKKQVFASYQDQVNKAMDLALDLRKDSTKEYLRSIGIVPNGSSDKKASSESSSGSSSSSSSSKSESSSSSSSSKKTSSSEEDNRPWWEKADDKHASAKNASKKAAGSKALSSQAKAYDQEHGNRYDDPDSTNRRAANRAADLNGEDDRDARIGAERKKRGLNR